MNIPFTKRGRVWLGIVCLFSACTSLPPASAPIVTGGKAHAPKAWITFLRHPWPKLSPEQRWADLVATHLDVRGRFQWVDDKVQYGGDYWTIMHSSFPYRGDCEDFALTCDAILARKGWPPADRRLAVVKTETGGIHAVLVARIAGGDYVLDNRQRWPMPWKTLPYTWNIIQEKSGGRWRHVKPP
ncbi:transglutaminase-like cysteine peptidase [Desulfoluna butyratoxydans]|uniref:Transglutaminase-like cysteine peptidase predicted n=1 Tax=Desulfoluna butyratoxydans TaxID=231438 RepID=A0A4V6ILA1_9BACT|nr:transglutaminase-like cysteine peptidase [Desulfoluna butyratoxydans]VFQ44378.1 transglutaminase-like cysteine peptidase predicted [Desulfoluna butyratoxydans]